MATAPLLASQQAKRAAAPFSLPPNLVDNLREALSRCKTARPQVFQEDEL
jgi:hypothetical protein